MNLIKLGLVSIVACGGAACASETERQADTAEDRVEQQAESNAAASGDTIAALGMTERQLLASDLVTADGTELGDVTQLRRNAQGALDGLLIEIENSDRDRFVIVPMNGLSARHGAMGNYVQTIMTAQDLDALPPASL